MPFIRWKEIPIHHRAKLLLYKQLQPVVDKLANFLQSRLSRRTVNERSRIFEGLGVHQGATDVLPILAGRLLSSTLVLNFLKMGSDEISAVPMNEERMMGQLSLLDGQCRQLIILTNDDEWAPAADAVYYRRSLSHTKVLLERGLTHGFTFFPTAIARIVNILAPFLGSDGRPSVLSKL